MSEEIIDYIPAKMNRWKLWRIGLMVGLTAWLSGFITAILVVFGEGA